MKKIILFFFFLLSFYAVSFSQTGEGELPVSWVLNLQNRVTPIELPPLDLAQVYLEDLINDQDKSMPWRYGIMRPVKIDFQHDGLLTELPNGDKVWLVAIHSPHAVNLSVNFDKFHLPYGGRLHLYNQDRTDISKTYATDNNRPTNQLGSWFVSGDIIWIEYFQPSFVSDTPKLEIGGIIHGYRMGQGIDSTRGMNDSGDCNFDVNCSIGSDFDSKKDVVKKAVALLNLGNGHLSTAVLINNVEGDKTPYILTGNHCLETSDPAFWSLRFNWMSPSPVCGTGEESTNIQTNFTMSGGELKASNALSDFALVELFNDIPDTWDVSFAGWDNSDALPEYEIGIHHPQGDIMKICRDDSGAVRENAAGTEVWLIKGVSAGNGDGWEIGTTESGSSGSPLFDQNGRIIGQLYAGESFCDGTSNNGDYDIYGRFAVSWNAGNTPQTRLRDWLDPQGTGQGTIETLQNILNIPDNEITGALDIYPNPATTEITVMNTRYPNLSYRLYTVTGQQLLEGSLSSTMNTISVETFKKGVYFLYLTDPDSNSEITKKIIVNR